MYMRWKKTPIFTIAVVVRIKSFTLVNSVVIFAAKLQPVGKKADKQSEHQHDL